MRSLVRALLPVRFAGYLVRCLKDQYTPGTLWDGGVVTADWSLQPSVGEHRCGEEKAMTHRSPVGGVSLPFGGSAVWGPSWHQAVLPCGVAEAGRTRGFAALAFAGCAFVDGWCD